MESTKKLRKCIWLTLLVFIIFFSLVLSISAVEWEDTTQPFRVGFNISGVSQDIDNLTIEMIINSGNMGTNFSFTNDRDSFRIYYYNETSQTHNLVSHYSDDWSTINNNATIQFRAPFVNASADTTYYMYFGNSSLSNIEDYCSTYIYCDLFDDANISSKLYTTDQDGVAGTSFVESAGVLNITAGGDDTWTGDDEYGSVYLRDIEGDVDIRVTVVDSSAPNVWTKAGIMLKNDMTGAGISTGYAFNVRTPGNGYSFQRDENNNGFLETNTEAGAPSVSPSYLRLIKNTTTIGGFYSKTTPETWSHITNSTITSINTEQDIGLSVTSHAGTTLAYATFDNLTVSRYTEDVVSVSIGASEELKTNMTIWDEVEIDGSPYANLTRYTNQDTRFFANYTFTIQPVVGGSCTINFTGSTDNSMSYDYRGFYYYDRQFVTSGNYSYNISCSKTGYESFVLNDSIEILDSIIDPSTNWGITTSAFGSSSSATVRCMGGTSPPDANMQFNSIDLRVSAAGNAAIGVYFGGSQGSTAGATKQFEILNQGVSAGWNTFTAPEGISWPANTTTWLCWNSDGPAIYYSSSSGDSGDFYSTHGRHNQGGGGNPSTTFPSTLSQSFSNFWYSVNANYSIVIADTENPVVNLTSPVNNTFFSLTNNVTFSANVTDNDDLSMCTLWTNRTGNWLPGEAKSVSGTQDNETWSVTDLVDGRYKWNVECCDSSDNCAFANDDYEIEVTFQASKGDVTDPIVNFVSPADQYTSYASITTLTCDATDETALKNISLYITNSSNESFSLDTTSIITGLSDSQSWGKSLTTGTFTWACGVYDGGGNFDMTGNRTLFVNFTPFAPTQGVPILNTTFGFNHPAENLTCNNISTIDLNLDYVKNIYNWYRNDQSITMLNMPFEGGSNDTFAKDYSEYSNNVTSVTGSPQWVSDGGYDGRGAFNFSGSGDYLFIPDANSIGNNGGLSELTVAFWMYSRDNSQYHRVLGTSNNWNTNGYNFYTRTAAGQQIAFNIDNNFVRASNVAVDDWMHIVGTYDGSTMTLYLDGVFAGSNNGKSGNINANSQNGLYIGEILGYTTDSTFDGLLDEILIMNHSLSADEVALLYNNQSHRLLSESTNSGEDWQCEITPNDGTFDGNSSLSNIISIFNYPPKLSVYSPVENNSYYVHDFVTINVSGTDYDLDSVWYYNGTSDVTYSGVTQINITPGLYDFEFYANDTSGNINNTNVSFNVWAYRPNVSLTYPLNNTKIVDTDVVEFSWLPFDNDTSTLNSTVYVNGILSGSKICISGIECALNISGIANGYNNWSVNVTDEYSQSNSTGVGFFTLIYEKILRISKVIESSVSNLYVVNISIENLINMSVNNTHIELIPSEYVFGSQSPIEDFNISVSGFYIGNLYIWNMTIPQLTDVDIDYGVTGVGDYNILDLFILSNE